MSSELSPCAAQWIIRPYKAAGRGPLMRHRLRLERSEPRILWLLALELGAEPGAASLVEMRQYARKVVLILRPVIFGFVQELHLGCEHLNAQRGGCCQLFE